MSTLSTGRVWPPEAPEDLAAPENVPSTPSAVPPSQGVLTREILVPAVVVVLGAIMTILDATIVNVAIPTLGQDLHTSILTIQWVSTIYLLAFASVIPLSGWAAGRFGAKSVWLASLGLFMLGSLLSGLSPSIGALLAFRLLQGLGAGMIMPLGQSILAQVAGPKRMGRVMSIIGVPMLLVPIFGPLIGGSLISAASWRWIFFVNLPVGVVAIVLAIRLLPAAPPRSGPRPRCCRSGVALGRARPVPLRAGPDQSARPAGNAEHARPHGGGGGPGLFVRPSRPAGAAPPARRASLPPTRFRQRRCGQPRGRRRPLRGRTAFAAVLRDRPRSQPPRHRVAFAPQGLGAALSISLAGYLTDKVGARRVVPGGVVLALFGTAWYTQIGAHTSYLATAAALLVIGLGMGATVTPAMAAAFSGLPAAAMGQATSMINVVQRVAGALGSALLAVVLQQAMTHQLIGFHGGIGQAGALAASSPHAAAALASAFGISFAVSFGVCLVALVPALLLPGRSTQIDPPPQPLSEQSKGELT